jgi:hypothetical protein
MNLSMDSLRIITVRALLGRTWAGVRVFDSPANPANLRFEEERAPFLAVYVDDGDQGSEDGGEVAAFSLDLPAVWLIIECAVAISVAIDPSTREPVQYDEEGNAYDSTGNPVSEPQTITTLQETDAASEIQIGLLAQQAVSALQATDNPWAELWRIHTAAGIRKVEVRRGGNGMPGTEGVRFASRLMRIRAELTPTPPQGDVLPVDGFWAKFFDMCANEPDLSALGQLMKSHLTLLGGTTLVDWRAAQKITGVTEEAIRAIGISPVVTPEDEQHLLQSIATEDPEGGQRREIDPGQFPPDEPASFPYGDL